MAPKWERRRREDVNWGVSVKQIWSQIGRLSAVMGLGLLVASCTAIRPEHCPYTDWRATGELHASKGYKSRLPGLFETCMAIGVLPDGDAYVAGYQRGLLGFCTIENGWTWGEHRSVNPGICPPATSPGFDRAFGTRASLEQLAVEEASMESRRDELEEMVVSGEFSDETLLRELRNLRKDLDRLEVERLRTRNGFAHWLRHMGLEAPQDLYNY